MVWRGGGAVGGRLGKVGPGAYGGSHQRGRVRGGHRAIEAWPRGSSLPSKFRLRRVQGTSLRQARTKERHMERLPRGRTCEFTRTGRTRCGDARTSLSHPQTPHQTLQVSRWNPKSTHRSDEATQAKQHTKRDSMRLASEQEGESIGVREHAGRSAMLWRALHVGMAYARLR
jgi:hypothetical protein